jgi:hypothetical protein
MPRFNEEGSSGNKDGSQLGAGSLKNLDRWSAANGYWVQAPVKEWHHWPTLHIWCCLDIGRPAALEDRASFQ